MRGIKVRSEYVRIRKWGHMFYITISCSARNCGNHWKSSYYQDQDAAGAYARKVIWKMHHYQDRGRTY